MARAQTLAAQLAFPVEDPVVNSFDSLLSFLRWMGSGSEWKVLLMIGAFGSALGRHCPAILIRTLMMVQSPLGLSFGSR